MKTRKPGVGSGIRNIGGWVLGLGLGLALVMAPVYGQAPEFNLAQKVPALPSENSAVFLSVLGTVAAVASGYSQNGYVFLTAVAVGPSLGFLYGGCWGRGILTAVLRIAVTYGVAALAFGDEAGCSLGYIWIGTMIGTSLLDIATVRRTVRRHNEAVTARRGLKVDVSPFAMPKGGGIQVRLGF